MTVKKRPHLSHNKVYMNSKLIASYVFSFGDVIAPTVYQRLANPESFYYNTDDRPREFVAIAVYLDDVIMLSYFTIFTSSPGIKVLDCLKEANF